MKCEGTVAQSGRESSVQMEANQLMLVGVCGASLLQIRNSEVRSLSQNFIIRSLETMKMRVFCKRKLQGLKDQQGINEQFDPTKPKCK